LILVAAAPARRRRRRGIEVVVPPAQADKADPDTYLRGLVHADAAIRSITEPTVRSNSCRCEPVFVNLSISRRVVLVQLGEQCARIAHSLPDATGTGPLAPLAIEDRLAGFAATIRNYGGRNGMVAAPSPLDGRDLVTRALT
jgi:hypothetical protein